MVATCANPDCQAEFRYLHEGKIFSLEPRLVAGAESKAAPTPTEHFWLCGACSRTMTLAFHPARKVILIGMGNAGAPAPQLLPATDRGQQLPGKAA